MKKILKIFLVAVSSLFLVLAVTVSVVLWYVFTPEKLTPIVRKQAEKFIVCRSEIGEVELTFFSTFPDFGIKAKQFAIINPVAGAFNDTLIKVDELVGVVDVARWYNNKELVLTGLRLTGGSIFVFSDSLGNTNYDIVSKGATSSAPAASSETKLPTIDIKNVELKDINFRYDDLSLKLNTNIQGLCANINGTVAQDSISGNVKVSKATVSLEYNGEGYLQQASVQLGLPVEIVPSIRSIRLKNATASVNGLGVLLNGIISNDTITKGFETALSYKLASWPIKDILALVPPDYRSYLEGVDVDGLLSSQGSIKGIYNGTSMPLLDIHLMLEKGKLKYKGFPQLHDMEGDVAFCSDLKTDKVSFVRVNRFGAKTEKSSVNIEGIVNHLFTDLYCDLTTNAGLTLEEFGPMIPANMKVALKGKAAGTVKSSFSLSQLKKAQLEKMKLSGTVTLSDFSASYDSLSIKTDKSKIGFALPNPNASSNDLKFAFATVVSDSLEAGKLKSYHASLQNGSISLETSDVSDKTRVPDLKCSFDIGSFFATMDTVSLAITKPVGKVSLSPRPDKPDQPEIILSYNSGQIKTVMGKSSATIGKVNLGTDIVNDNTQKDIFLQWPVKGFIDMEQGVINIAGLSSPIEAPHVKMDFGPQAFNIKEGKIKIDKSDFQLIGNLNNVLSYFKGDSVLRGNFAFKSDKTDVDQLMALTNGIGDKDSSNVGHPKSPGSGSGHTGPYMVPKGIDVSLDADIKTVTFGVDSATNIVGKVQVRDGNLVLDGLTFATPAARIQLTAMYQTPRKNHLYLGLDYHLLDVEIDELLSMIPDIDSLMPMLRSFGGRGEFHIAVETYLDSMYNIKKSTLRGASSIKGNNLVLMDGETFSEIAKNLMFNKKTKNRVDSLSAEFTIFRNEIDVYPFLMVMDKYKAVIDGRHNIDLTFDYHISVIESPLPIKLGLDVKGNMDKYSVRLAKCKYPNYYRPAARHEVENRQLELRKNIRDMLTKKVKG